MALATARGETMAKANSKGRTKSGPPFVMMRYDVMDSPAWLSLNAASRAIYLQIARRYNGQNNGFLGASVDALASECKLAANTVTASLRRLIDVGLIERTREASFACKVRLAAEYRLCCFKCDKTGLSAKTDFKRHGQSATGDTDAGLFGCPAPCLPSDKPTAYG
jgi:hypothetical protein